MNKLTHLLVAGAAAWSLGAVAADDKQQKQDPLQQSKGLEASGRLDQKTTNAPGIGDASTSTGSPAEKSSAGVSDAAPSAGSSAERTAEPKSASGEHEAAQPTGEKPK